VFYRIVTAVQHCSLFAIMEQPKIRLLLPVHTGQRTTLSLCLRDPCGSTCVWQSSVLPKTEPRVTIIIMKCIVYASLLASAAAFAPVADKASSSTSLNAFESDIGALQPLGFWDPLGLVADGDQEKFDRLRGVELKHGRISMLAVVGYLFQEAGNRLPGDIDLSGTKFADIPNGYAALEAIPYAGKLQIFAFIGGLEVFVMRDFVGGEFVGDLRNNYSTLNDSFARMCH